MNANTAAPLVEPEAAAPGEQQLVHAVTLGSVDDGKSTLIGRLLYETGALYDDQVAAVRRASRLGGEIDFSLFTDGLRAEREQGITIDVAYRYFSTAKRKFILADAPGHAQYTRNMATAASRADVGVVLIDARHGLLPQGRRHLAIAALLGIPRIALAVNKMDAVGFDRARFERIAAEAGEFAARLKFADLRILPISAKDGDNVAVESPRTPWHRGGSVLEFLETSPVARDRSEGPLRLPVQIVIRTHDYRGYAGQLARGTVRAGDEVVVLPSGVRTRVKAIDTFEGELRSASAPMSIAIRLAHAVDVARGDLIACASHPPEVRSAVEANAVWLSERPLDPGRAYVLKHAARSVPARVEAVRWRLDPETLGQLPAQHLELNDIGRIAVRCGRPIVCDAYAADRTLGAFILVDALSNDTVAAGTIVAPEAAARHEARGDRPAAVSAEEKLRRLGHGPAAVLVERESEDAAAAVAGAVERALFERGYSTAAARTSEAALSCAAAGLVAICVSGGPDLARARLRAELRASGVPLVELRAEGAGKPAEEALAEVARVAPLLSG